MENERDNTGTSGRIVQRVIETERLRLRPFVKDDAADVQRMAGDPEVASRTLHIPHPYEDGMAEDWIARHADDLEAGTNVVYAMVLKSADVLVGTISCSVDRRNRSGEMGYWVGVPFWGNGYCTEAAAALLGFCFEDLGLNRVHAHHFGTNPASGRVMEKIGMRMEGTLREHIVKDGVVQDLVAYGVLSREYSS